MVEIDVYGGVAEHFLGMPLCTYGIPPQVTTTFQTHNGSADVELTVNLTGFEVKILKATSLFCGGGAGETLSGSYSGTETLSATKEGKAVSLMVG